MTENELVIAAQDYAQLARLARNGVLSEELQRATVVPLERMPQNIVRMHSRVTYAIDGVKGEHEVQLVFPDEADASAGKVSVLAPVGAALLGLEEGQSIDWAFFPDGNVRCLRVIRTQPPADGE